jgi:hypothetical protein
MLDDVSKRVVQNFETEDVLIGQNLSLNSEEIQYVNDLLKSVQTHLDSARIVRLDKKTGCKRKTFACLSKDADQILSQDYADLNEKDFIRMLNEVTDLAELEGVANRRKILNAPQLKTYSRWQRDLIMQKKWELEHG